jgi:hypothetical protein
VKSRKLEIGLSVRTYGDIAQLGTNKQTLFNIIFRYLGDKQLKPVNSQIADFCHSVANSEEKIFEIL